ncbi:MAG: hypothetical protein J1F20_03625 [Muribaculaceae bacterium]|nr:hypothetical protein [Muribaculaceae bacterium]
MKKFYAILAAAAIVTSASASIERHTLDGALNLPVKKEVKALDAKEVAHKATSKVAKKSVSKAIAEDGITGEYVWDGVSLIRQSEFQVACDIELVDAATGEVSIVLGGRWEVLGTYDAVAGTLSIPNMQYLFSDEDGPVYFYIKEYNELIGDFLPGVGLADETTATYQDESFVFPEMDIWAIGDPDHEELGYYEVSLANEFFVPIEWTYVGIGEWTENIISALFSVPAVPVEVEIYQHPEDEDVFMVTDPLKAFYADNEWDGASPSMLLDAEDPDNVGLIETSADFTYQGKEVFYCNVAYLNANYQLTDQNGQPTTIPEVPCVMTEDSEGNVTITFPVGSGIVLIGQSIYMPQGESVLTFKKGGEQDAVNNIATDNNVNAPVEYYNLQGVRVNNPAAGELVIKKQGTEINKVLVK